MPLVFKPAIPDAFRVACFAETVARQPIVRHWLLVIASESPRLRRALLARAARALRSELGGIEAAEALEQLRDIALVRAVIDTLFFEQGIPSLAPDQCTGRSARVRFSELAQKLQIREATLLVV